MHKYIIRRLLLTVVVILGVTLLTFVSIHLAGDPTLFYISERASKEERLEAQRRLGFDRPLHVQYLDFLVNLARGDTGTSLQHRVPAFGVVMERMPATLELTIGGFILSTVVAFPIGVIAATRRGTMTDGTLMLGAMLGQSMPSFWLGLMFIMFFGVTLGWLPISGHVPFLKPLLEGNAGEALANLPNAMRYLIMPMVAVIGLFHRAQLAPDPFRRPGGAAAGLRRHRPRQRLERTDSPDTPCHPQRYDPDCDRPRPAICLPLKWRYCDRDRLFLARRRSPGFRCHISARRPPRDDGGRSPFLPLRHCQPHRRPDVRRTRSTHSPAVREIR